DRKVSGFLAFEYAPDIDAGLAMGVRDVRSVAHQATGFGILAERIDSGHAMKGGERRNMDATVVGERAGSDHQRIHRLLRKAREEHVDVTSGAGMDGVDRLADGCGGAAYVRDVGLGYGPIGVRQHRNAYRRRQQLVQEPELLRAEHGHQEADAGDVAARSIEAGYQALLDRIASTREHDRYCR